MLGKIAKARETIKNTRVIVDDMRVNRKEYSSQDLSWRNVDLMRGIINAFEDLVDGLESISQVLEGGAQPDILEPNEGKGDEVPNLDNPAQSIEEEGLMNGPPVELTPQPHFRSNKSEEDYPEYQPPPEPDDEPDEPPTPEETIEENVLTPAEEPEQELVPEGEPVVRKPKRKR